MVVAVGLGSVVLAAAGAIRALHAGLVTVLMGLRRFRRLGGVGAAGAHLVLRAGRLGVGLGQLGQVLGRVGVEVLAAVLAAELDLLSLVDEDDGLALGAELLVGDNALVEGVGLRVGGLVGGDQAAG